MIQGNNQLLATLAMAQAGVPMNPMNMPMPMQMPLGMGMFNNGFNNGFNPALQLNPASMANPAFQLNPLAGIALPGANGLGGLGGPATEPRLHGQPGLPIEPPGGRRR